MDLARALIISAIILSNLDANAFAQDEGYLETLTGDRVELEISERFASSNLYDLHLEEIKGEFGFYGAITNIGNDIIIADRTGRLSLLEKKKQGYVAYTIPYRVPTNLSDYERDFDAIAYNDSQRNSFGVKDINARITGGTLELFAAHHFWYPDRKCGVLRLSLLRIPLETESDTGNDWTTLYETQPCLKLKTTGKAFAGHQAGGRIVITDNDTVILSVGDQEFDGVNADEIYPQKPDNSYGKTIEINIYNGAHSIHSIGHRNPQGLHLGADGVLWSTEHGPKGGDELNIVVDGGNYGWPEVTYGTNYGSFTWPLSDSQGDHKGFRIPFYAWVPSIGISQLTSVTGDLFDLWRGDLIVSSLAYKTIFRVRIREERVVFVEPIRMEFRIRDIMELPDGTVAMKGDWGKVVLLSPATAAEIEAASPDSPAAQATAEPDVPMQDVSRPCKGCHTFERGEPHGIGPNLWDVYGSDIASAEGYQYSAALRSTSGRWNPEALDRFLEAPAQFAPGTTMNFAGIGDPDARQAVIDFLETLRPDE